MSFNHNKKSTNINYKAPCHCPITYNDSYPCKKSFGDMINARPSFVGTTPFSSPIDAQPVLSLIDPSLFSSTTPFNNAPIFSSTTPFNNAPLFSTPTPFNNAPLFSTPTPFSTPLSSPFDTPTLSDSFAEPISSFPSIEKSGFVKKHGVYVWELEIEKELIDYVKIKEKDRIIMVTSEKTQVNKKNAQKFISNTVTTNSFNKCFQLPIDGIANTAIAKYSHGKLQIIVDSHSEHHKLFSQNT